MDHISILPSELLSAIFEAGALCVPQVPRRRSNDNAPTPFPILVSSICQAWREIAISTPPIWSSICVDRGFDEGYLSLWINRSKSCPLDITVACMQLESLSPQAMQLLTSQSQRWQRLRIVAHNRIAIESLISSYRNLHFPILRSLQFEVREHEPWPRLVTGPWNLEGHKPLLDAELPLLCSVRIVGLCSGCCGNLMKGLTTIEISSFAPSYSEMSALVSDCPNLSTLILPAFSCGGVMGASNEELPPIEIPSLTSLAISFDWNHSALPCKCLLPFFSMPNLAYLEISGEDWSPHLSTHFPTPSGSTMFVKLKTLRLHALDLSGVGVEFFHVFPSLTDLELVDVGNVTSLDLSVFVSTNEASEFRGQYPWKSLKRIKLDANSSATDQLLTWLSETIRRRKEIQLPLSQVCMTNFMYQATESARLDEIRTQVQVEILPLEDEGLMDMTPETDEDEEDAFNDDYLSSSWQSEADDFEYDSDDYDVWDGEEDFDGDDFGE